MAAMPESARHVHSPAVEAPFTPDGGTQ
jgi:hypothetical protein